MRSKKDLAAITISDEITSRKTNDILIPYIEERIEKFGDLRMYIELEEVENIEPNAVWRDLKFDVQYLHDFKKIAIVEKRNGKRS